MTGHIVPLTYGRYDKYGYPLPEWWTGSQEFLLVLAILAIPLLLGAATVFGAVFAQEELGEETGPVVALAITLGGSVATLWTAGWLYNLFARREQSLGFSAICIALSVAVFAGLCYLSLRADLGIVAAIPGLSIELVAVSVWLNAAWDHVGQESGGASGLFGHFDDLSIVTLVFIVGVALFTFVLVRLMRKALDSIFG